MASIDSSRVPAAKRPRPVDPDQEVPDLADFQRTFDLDPQSMIKLCTAYASYLKATLAASGPRE